MSAENDTEKSFRLLRNLLITPEKDKIGQIEDRLDDPMVRAREISQSLPHAISLSINESDKISRVIEPVIDQSLKESIKNNPKAFADAIFPALGPGIRKAITSTLMGMIQSLNQVLNHSFSFQGLKWRFEAFKTRRPFAEVVLLHTLVYQVEQIFLIHKETGLVLDHVVSKDAVIQDPDLVSAMLTAIQDFIQDSFESEEANSLETIRSGSDRSIWIETGEHALIAAVIRGTPPVELRTFYQELIEEIHIKAVSILKNFNGDTTPFSIFTEQLKDGLQFQEKSNRKKISPWLWIILLVLVALFSYLGHIGYNYYQSYNQSRHSWNQYLEQLNNQKGLFVLSVRKQDRVYTVNGLKDPLIQDPAADLTEEQRQHFSVKAEWQDFYSLESDLVFKRAENILTPPQGVSLTLEKNIISATGRASHDWIDQARIKAAAIPGVTGIDLSKIENIEATRLNVLTARLMETRIYFENNSSRFVDGQEETLSGLIKNIQAIELLQSELKNIFLITILGHTDSSGTEKLNLKLSRNRAETTLNYLIVNGINPAFLNISGIGPKVPLIKEQQEADRQYNRAVSFKIFYIDSTKGD